MLRLLLFGLALVACAPGQPFIYYRGVANAASYVPSGLPNGQIARGSIFSVFGRAMGPAAGAQVSAFPLGNTLAGVGLDVCQESACVPAIPIYVRQDQINAIMPSNAPLGAVSLRVTFNGVAGNFTSATVVSQSTGIFTINSGGFGPAVAQNFNSATDQPVNSTTVSAKPGQTIILWATGLGSGLNADSLAPQVGDLPVQLDIWVGGKQVATKRYQGRSGCCSGLDQIIFDLPEDTPTGCYVPIQVLAGGTLISNSATIAVSAEGGSCADPFNPISERFRQGGKAGLLVASRSNTLHNYVTFQPEVTTEAVTATFRTLPGGPFYFDPQISLPPVGSCTVHTARGDLFGGDDLLGFLAPASELNAGPEIRVGGVAVPRDEVKRFYAGQISSEQAGVDPPSRIFTSPFAVSGPGGADVGAFQFTLQPPGPITFTNRADLEVANRTKDLVVSWQGTDEQRDVILVTGVGVNLPENSSAQFICTASPSSSSFTIPSRILRALPSLRERPSAEDAFSYVFVGRMPLRAPTAISVSGADAGFALATQWAGKAVVIQ